MVNTRSKIKKTRNALKNCFPQASVTDSDHQAISSADLVASNDDLLTEILLRLPVTAIRLFKSVSKHWWWLLSNRRFTLMFDKASISPGLFVRYKYFPFDVEDPDTCTPPFHNLGFYPDINGIRIMQSCNGLLLCCSNRGSTRSRKYYVFNPTTKKFAVIPSVPGVDDVRRYVRFVGLAYHPTSCPHYKLVCILSSVSEGLFIIQVYLSNTREWKTLYNRLCVNYTASESYDAGVYWNGVIHWAMCCPIPLAFNFNIERLQRLPLPRPVAERAASSGSYTCIHPPVYFGESRGHLHLVDTTFHDNCFRMNVYEMSSDYTRWFVKYTEEIDHDPPGFHFVQIRRHHRLCGFEVVNIVRGEKEEDTFLVLKTKNELIRYNVFGKSLKRISDVREGYFSRIGQNEIHRYIQSLTPF